MNNNNWNTVDWDEIPEDVAAVVTFDHSVPSYYKVVDGEVYVQCWRSHHYEKSFYNSLNGVSGHYGEHFHLRPTSYYSSCPESPESTQVESSEVEDATTPEFDWSSVEEDVEAVLLVGVKIEQVFKEEGDKLLYRTSREAKWHVSKYPSIKDREDRLNEHSNYMSARVLRRPPATTHPEGNVACKVELDHGLFKDELDLLSRNLTPKEFEWYKRVSAQMREDLLKDFTTSTISTETYTPKPPSISTILQEAQQSILKHHGVTGKVSFTVTCSE